MRLDPNPLFRRAITPWYDGAFACLVLMAAMLIAVAFGAIGIAVARDTPEFQDHEWIPWLIMVAALLVFFSVTVRVVRRRLSERYGTEHTEETE
jgi:membrane protein DedA with SNARE-associated domain